MNEWRRLPLEEEEEEGDLEVAATVAAAVDELSSMDHGANHNNHNNNNSNDEESSSSSSLHHLDDDDAFVETSPLQQQQQQRQTIRAILFLTLVFESVTCFFRFGLGMESTRDTASTVGRYITGGIRIHHGYVGILLLLIVRIMMLCSTPRTAPSRHCSCCGHHCRCCRLLREERVVQRRGRHDHLHHHAAHWIWWMRVVGWSLITSDLVHHFLVLWPLTGSPHFDWVYPKT